MHSKLGEDGLFYNHFLGHLNVSSEQIYWDVCEFCVNVYSIMVKAGQSFFELLLHYLLGVAVRIEIANLPFHGRHRYNFWSEKQHACLLKLNLLITNVGDDIWFKLKKKESEMEVGKGYLEVYCVWTWISLGKKLKLCESAIISLEILLTGFSVWDSLFQVDVETMI